MKYQFLRYHRFLFRWHCRHFFDFKAAMTKTEMEYLEECFNLCKAFEEVSEAGYEHFSYYTYSHRVKGDKVNSSRIAYGSVEHAREAWEPAKPVLAERGIALPERLAEENLFYGLGWDIEEGQFKVYFRSLDWRKLPPSFSDLVEGYKYEEHLTEALLSLTYEGQEVVERKVYLYPRVNDSVSGVRGAARMITDRRGEVVQDDLLPDQEIPYELNATGKHIVNLYQEELEEQLDTITYKNSEDFTLYFP